MSVSEKRPVLVGIIDLSSAPQQAPANKWIPLNAMNSRYQQGQCKNNSIY